VWLETTKYFVVQYLVQHLVELGYVNIPTT